MCGSLHTGNDACILGHPLYVYVRDVDAVIWPLSCKSTQNINIFNFMQYMAWDRQTIYTSFHHVLLDFGWLLANYTHWTYWRSHTKFIQGMNISVGKTWCNCQVIQLLPPVLFLLPSKSVRLYKPHYSVLWKGAVSICMRPPPSKHGHS